MNGRALMVQGTASGVGKSWVVTAICRLLQEAGVKVAPFKAQNMSNNAAVTAAGLEVGRAQAVQALAAGVAVDARMNPILLKPLADDRSAVIVMGAPRPELESIPWHERRPVLWPYVESALDALLSDHEVVVIEGAGSPAEINLARSDIVNMSVAHHARAPVLLVADMHRGGAFAAALGTWALLDRADRERIAGVLLNRFRGDPTLLGEAPQTLEAHMGVPVWGPVPWVEARLPEEDGAEWGFPDTGPWIGRRTRIGVVRLPRISNLDEFDALALEPSVDFRWVDAREEIPSLDLVILPGTRNSLDDLAWLRRTGLARAIEESVRQGGHVLGICGGFQMLGAKLCDPASIEAGGEMDGLGLLDLETTLAADKTTRQVEVEWIDESTADRRVASGYEIHHGTGRFGQRSEAFMWERSARDTILGARTSFAWGIYVHGLLEDDRFRDAVLRWCGGASTKSAEGRLESVFTQVAQAIETVLPTSRILELIEAGGAG